MNHPDSSPDSSVSDAAVSHQPGQLLEALQRALGALALGSEHPLSQDVDHIAQRFSQGHPSGYRVAVFGPFNQGKSTLLNAILGDKTLPMDLIPTTGAAIVVRYGPKLQTRLTLADGTVKTEEGIELLSQFAILDEQRRMREDVASIEIESPHPLLEQGLELLDLPGTNDREAQDELIYQQLLSADLVIQLLDGRKLMTLGEREHLRDWLQERGIETVIFVVNFLNLLEPEDRKPVMNRMRFVAEGFRSELPDGISNLYRVDALPALRAKLKGDAALLQASGLLTLVAAVEQLAQQQESAQTFEARLIHLSQQVANQLRQRITRLEEEQLEEQQEQAQNRDRDRREIQLKAQSIIRQGLERDLTQLRDWLTLSALLDRYEAEAVEALRQFEFKAWEAIALKPDWERLRDSVVDWVTKAQNFAATSTGPCSLELQFPEEPWIDPDVSSSNPQQPNPTRRPPGRDTLLAGGLGWALGGPIGAAVVGGTNYVLNQLNENNHSVSPPSPAPQPTGSPERLHHATQRYFERLSYAGQAAVNAYSREAEKVLQSLLDETNSTDARPPVSLQSRHELALLQGILQQLENLNNCKS